MLSVKLKFLLLVAALAMANFTSVQAQQSCDSILIGIHQREFVSSESSKLKTTLEILKRYEVSSYEQARNTAASAGFSLPIEGVPVPFKFGYKSDSSGKGNWSSQLETYFSSRTDEATRYAQQIEKANKDVVEAWSKCVSNRSGVSAWAEQESNSGEFVILIGYRPTSMVNATITEIEFGSQFESLSNVAVYKNKQLKFDGSPTIVRVKRRASSNEQGQIIVRTTVNDAYINLLAFPKVNSTPLPPRPPVDFDNDRLSDSYGFTGAGPYLIEVTLGNGESVRTNLPPGYNPYLPQTQFVTGDFNGDGFTDLVAVVTSGADKAHIHLSKGDGSFFDNKEFFFRPVANPKGDYSTIGAWSSKYCGDLGRSVLHHSPVPGAHDPNVKGGYYWIPARNGTAFSITSSDPCPAKS